MTVPKRTFQVGITGSILFIVFFTVFSGLSWWQYQRTQEKLQLQEDYEYLLAQSPVELGKGLEKQQLQRFMKIKARGRFLSGMDIFLDNIIMQGKAGYHVITPLKIAGTDSVIMVNRGWVSAGKDRKVLPVIETPLTEIEISGRLDRPRSKPVGLPDSVRPDTEANQLWLYLDIPYFMEKSGVTGVLKDVVLLDGEEQHGFVREWPGYDAKVGMHIGYTIHWAAFALASLLIYLWFGFHKKDTDG